jgi:23S rRNA U2552 (ribose-2'-O)-methylase RlmE/FtsJ
MPADNQDSNAVCGARPAAAVPDVASEEALIVQMGSSGKLQPELRVADYVKDMYSCEPVNARVVRIVASSPRNSSCYVFVVGAKNRLIDALGRDTLLARYAQQYMPYTDVYDVDTLLGERFDVAMGFDSPLDDGRVLRVRVNPPSVIDSVRERTKASAWRGVEWSNDQFTHLVSLVDVEGYVYVDVSSSADDDDGDKERSFEQRRALISPEALQLPGSRAAYKLHEAMLRVGSAAIKLSADMDVIDLGAAPGGWSALLAKRVRSVVAVDPAEMTERADNLRHMQMKSQQAIDILLGEGKRFAALVCDMNIDFAQVADIVKPFDCILLPGAALIVTLKLAKRRGPGFDALLVKQEQRFKQVFPGYENVRVVALIANRFEATLLATKPK